MNKYEALAKPFKLFDNVFDKAKDKALVQEHNTLILRLIRQNDTLKKSLRKAGELIEELKTENKLQKSQLRTFGKVFDNFSGKEVDAEFNEEEFNNNKKGESDHE